VALVVAETFEQARAAPAWCKVEYVKAKGEYDLAAAKDSAKVPKKEEKPETKVRRLRRRLRQRAGQARRHLHHARPVARDDGAACVDRRWEGDKLTLWTSNQMIAWGKKATWRRRSASRRKTCA
jgi:xanthine dehydrogenase YagR molybdenum-binding subunit